MPTFNLEVSLSNTIDWISNNKVKNLDLIGIQKLKNYEDSYNNTR